MTTTSLKMFWYNISFAWNSFYKHRLNVQLLTNPFVSNNIKASVKLQASMANEQYLHPFLNERQCVDTAILKLWNYTSLLSHWLGRRIKPE